MYSGTQDKKIWPITTPSILMPGTIRRYAHGTSTCTIHPEVYHVQQRLALCEGVLELYPTDISVRPHCPESGSRVTGEPHRAEYRPCTDTVQTVY